MSRVLIVFFFCCFFLCFDVLLGFDHLNFFVLLSCCCHHSNFCLWETDTARERGVPVACPHGAQMANLFSPAWFRLFSQQKPRMLQMKSIHLFLSDLNRWSLIILHFLYLSSVIEPRTEIEERACSCVLPGWSVSNVPSKPITPKGKAERHFLSEMRDNGEEQTGTTGHVHHRGSVWHTAPRHCHRKQKASF